MFVLKSGKRCEQLTPLPQPVPSRRFADADAVMVFGHCSQAHRKRIGEKHLKDVMQDTERSLALSAEYEGTILDFSRMNVSFTFLSYHIFLFVIAGTILDPS